MTTRTTTTTVNFARPFTLGDSDEALPAGTYSVETDEELLEGLSFPAYRRLVAAIQLPAEPEHPGVTRTAMIDPDELDAALSRDAAPATAGADQNEDDDRTAVDRADDEGRIAATGQPTSP